MKLQKFCVGWDEIDKYLEKYQGKIKFIFHVHDKENGMNMGRDKFVLIIDMS
jgi:hypothetical protein